MRNDKGCFGMNISIRYLALISILSIGAMSTASAKTLYLDELEVSAELPTFEVDSFFIPRTLTGKAWMPRELSSDAHEELLELRERLDQALNGCRESKKCQLSDTDLRLAHQWLKRLISSDDPRSHLQAGLLRGAWLAGTYHNDARRLGEHAPVLDTSDAVRYLESHFAFTNESDLQAANLYARAKISLWGHNPDGAIRALMFVDRIPESTLTQELFAWLAGLEESRGRLSIASDYYRRVRYGKYLAASLLGIARTSRHLGLCDETLRVGARFQTKVGSSEERERYLSSVLREEAECEELTVGEAMVRRLDGINAPVIHEEAAKIRKQRASRRFKDVFIADVIACFNVQFPDAFKREPLDFEIAGTSEELELSPTGDASLLGSNVVGELEACLQRRLLSGFGQWRIEGDIRVIPKS